MRSLLAYTFSATLGVAASPIPPTTGINLSSLCEYDFEHCPTAVSATNISPSKTVPFGNKKSRLSNAHRRARGIAHKASEAHRRQSDPSGIPQQVRTDVMQVYNGNTPLGYLSATTQDGAIHRLESSLIDAVILSVVSPTTQTKGSGLRASVSGSDISAQYPLLGLVQGRDNVDSNIGPGSYHYLYLAGVALPGTISGASASVMNNSYSASSLVDRAAETDVWDIDFTTSIMTPKWTNIGGDSPITTLFSQAGIVYGGGDMAAFASEYSAGVTSLIDCT